MKIKYMLFIILFFTLFSLMLLNFIAKKNYQISYKKSGDINVNNKLPISDYAGINIDSNSDVKNLIDIEVKNNNIGKAKYEIYLVKTSMDNSINDQNIKLSLSKDGKIILNTTYAKLFVSSSVIEGKRLVVGNLPSLGSSKYKLRVWVSEEEGINNNLKVFTSSIYVKSL